MTENAPVQREENPFATDAVRHGDDPCIMHSRRVMLAAMAKPLPKGLGGRLTAWA